MKVLNKMTEQTVDGQKKQHPQCNMGGSKIKKRFSNTNIYKEIK